MSVAVPDVSSLTLDELFEEFKKVPDWDRMPMPEAFYQHFKVKKPQAATLQESVCYQPPPYQSLNENGKVEIRPPAEGGVREIKEFQELPTEVKLLDETTNELVPYPPPKPRDLNLINEKNLIEEYVQNFDYIKKFEELMSSLNQTK